jgi:hypothetical protein
MQKSDERPDFEESCALMRQLGFVVQDAKSTPAAFGSWYICAVAQGKSLRLVWDGRDGALFLQEPSLSGLPGDWGDRWAAGQGYAQKPSDLKNALLLVLNGSGR